MTDKQIIIDGIDVSRCRHYDDRYGYCEACRDDIDGASFTKCLYEDNCYYKQYKRSEAQCEAMFVSHTDLEKKYKAKEQECEGLKDKLNCCFCNPYVELNDIEKQQKCVEVTECFRRQCDQLKAENKELKKTVNDLLHKPEIQDKILWKIDNEALLCSKDVWIYKLEQTLAKIKEIAESAYCLTNGTNKDMANFAKQILQKISECEVE